MFTFLKQYLNTASQRLPYYRRRVRSILVDIPRYFFKSWFYITGYFSTWSFFFSNSDFILRIAPLKARHLKHNKEYFPPPGYGVPLGRKTTNRCLEPYSHGKYGLFLWPGKLVRAYFPFILFVNTLIILPFISSSSPFEMTKNYPWLFSISLVLISAYSFWWVFRQMSPVLSQVWREWPESQYNQFLTVPHKVELTLKDKCYTSNQKISFSHQCVLCCSHLLNNSVVKDKTLYWQPGIATPMRHQSSYYASDMKTLQEVILHLAVFDFFFHNTSASSDNTGYFKSIRIDNWFYYLLSPVWLSYLILLIFLFIYQLQPPSFGC